MAAFKIELDYIVVVDVEHLCWEKDAPETSFPEIIQIGACKLFIDSLEVNSKKSYYVKPKYGKVSEKCFNLTGITQEKLNAQGTSFIDALNKFNKDFGLKHRQWASYGDDGVLFRQQCQFFACPYYFSPSHLNVALECAKLLGNKKGRSLEDCCDALDIECKGHGDFHSADNDAYYTAMVLAKLMKLQRIGLNGN